MHQPSAIYKRELIYCRQSLLSGKYRTITGNTATAWGLLAASERSGRQIFLGSYPITPATDIMVELAKYKSLEQLYFRPKMKLRVFVQP